MDGVLVVDIVFCVVHLLIAELHLKFRTDLELNDIRVSSVKLLICISSLEVICSIVRVGSLVLLKGSVEATAELELVGIYWLSVTKMIELRSGIGLFLVEAPGSLPSQLCN